MLRNADSAKENEDPYPGRISLIEHCNGQSAFGNACNIVASAKNLFFPVATILQASKALFLRCNNLASPQKHFLLVATILQMPKTTFSSLQQSCKPPKALSPRCNNLANAKNHFFPVATILQAPKSTFPSLQQCCKHFQKHFGHRVASVENPCWLYSYIGLTLRRA